MAQGTTAISCSKDVHRRLKADKPDGMEWDAYLTRLHEGATILSDVDVVDAEAVVEQIRKPRLVHVEVDGTPAEVQAWTNLFQDNPLDGYEFIVSPEGDLDVSEATEGQADE